MRALVQRVSYSRVSIPEKNFSASINHGLLILLGIKEGDKPEDVIFTADKCCNLRIFEDENGKMNLSLKEVDGEIMVISQFTLYGDARKGNRPNFTLSAKPEEAIPLYEQFINRCKDNIGSEKVASGIFGAMMKIELLNDGPVTILVESKNG